MSSVAPVAPSFAPHRVVVFSELNERDKERMFDFLLDQKIEVGARPRPLPLPTSPPTARALFPRIFAFILHDKVFPLVIVRRILVDVFAAPVLACVTTRLASAHSSLPPHAPHIYVLPISVF